MSADPIDLPLRVLLDRLLSSAPAAESDPNGWIDIKEQPLVVPRELAAAGKRGELALYRVGRRTLVKRSELDRWIQLPEHRVTAQCTAEQEPPSRVDHILQRAGYRKVGAG